MASGLERSPAQSNDLDLKVARPLLVSNDLERVNLDEGRWSSVVEVTEVLAESMYITFRP